MKKIKKMIALMLSLVLALGMLQTASAQSIYSPSDGLKYVIENGEEVEVANTARISVYALRTVANTQESTVVSNGSLTIKGLQGEAAINAYKLINITKVDGGKYQYGLNKGNFGGLFDTLSVSNTKEFNTKLENGGSAEIISAVREYIEKKNTAADVSEPTDGGTEYTLSDVPYGFYYVSVISEADDGIIYNPMLVLIPTITKNEETGEITENEAVSATVKSSEPKIEKKIVEGTQEVTETTKNIGDIVEYKVNATVPYYTEAIEDEDVIFTITDTMSNGLTYRYDAVAKDSSGNEIANAFTQTVTKNADGTTKIEWKFDYSKIKGSEGDTDIIVTYSAALNETAVLGNRKSNNNSVTLEYTSDPKIDTSEGTTPTKTTTEQETKVYTLALEIKKHELGDSSVRLDGAEFTLKTSDGRDVYFKQSSVAAEAYIYRAVVAGGAYTITKDENTKTETYTATATINEEEVKIKGLTKTAVTSAKVTYDVDENGEEIKNEIKGELVIIGLAEGEYELTETKAPEGYYAYKSPHTITMEAIREGGILTGDVKQKESEYISAYFIKWIPNSTEYTLPTTGGIGTMIFLGVGIMMAAAACVLLYRRRRL